MPLKKTRFALALAVTIIVIGYQLFRVIAFVNVYGGIEHDGGWMLSISRSLVEQGSYTTMVSTIADPRAPTGINVDQKFDVQAPDGRIWFFTGNGVGPASIVPDALILKIFGTDFWALRAGPLIFYALLLFLAAFILLRLAGLAAVLLFFAFLFFYPHLSIFLSYEAMGEVPTMFYVLLAYVTFAASLRLSPARRWILLLGAGIVAGLAINAKLIALWSVSGIFVWAAALWLVTFVSNRRGVPFAGTSPIETITSDNFEQTDAGKCRLVQLDFSQLLSLFAGTLLPLMMWELVHFGVLTRLVGDEAYIRHVQQRIKFILDDGSGVGLRTHSGPEFFWDKFFMFQEVAHPQRWVTAILLAIVLVGGLILLWQWRARPGKHNLLAPIWIGWLANTAWFVGLAKTGWARHYWFGLVLAIILLSIIPVVFWQHGLSGLRRNLARKRSSIAWLAVGTGVMLLIGWGFSNQPHVWGFLLPDQIVPYWQDKQINNRYESSLPWIIIPRQAQIEVADYIKKMPPEANVYYPGQHKAAELPPQTGRVHYPLKRRDYLEPHPGDIVLIGPSMISPWQESVRRRDLLQLVARQCPRPAVVNDYYMICPIADNLPEQ